MNIFCSSWVAEAHAGESLNLYSIRTCVQENDRNRSRSGSSGVGEATSGGQKA